MYPEKFEQDGNVGCENSEKENDSTQSKDKNQLKTVDSEVSLENKSSNSSPEKVSSNSDSPEKKPKAFNRPGGVKFQESVKSNRSKQYNKYLSEDYLTEVGCLLTKVEFFVHPGHLPVRIIKNVLS